ncbi:callose synthase 9 [Tripterygium wilfordii]|uniref:Callose synthase 9 n=1 Tax=Tripterygium wilfordii TaxID=458696 RepID=A0A7J7DR15_TRIWF|nr:callose synthase 9 [Tripterygium wilfordii]
MKLFGCQKDNVSNQREHVIHLLANEQSQLGVPDETEPRLDEAAVQNVFLKSLENYINWCSYLCIQPVWSNLEAVSKEKKILFVSLYFLIWGEASNVRFFRSACATYFIMKLRTEIMEEHLILLGETMMILMNIFGNDFPKGRVPH